MPLRRIARLKAHDIMHYWVVLQLVVLLALANGSPIVVKWTFGSKGAWPLDGNMNFIDGRPLFGASKTIRGIAVSLFVTSACAPLLGLTAPIGLLVAGVAMGGDLFSSFIKRRLGLRPGGKATGLDQIPESLFSLLACRQILSLTVLDIIAGTAIFFIGAMVLSRLLFELHVRDRPY